MRSQIIDCHAHIVDPSVYPYEDGPGYKPKPHEAGTLPAYAEALGKAGIEHGLLVQPSCYGYDNSGILDILRKFPGKFRAIGMVPPTADGAALDALAKAGIVGARFNLISYDADIFHKSGIGPLLQRMKALGWFAEVVANADQWRRDADLLLASGVKILVDHFGMHGFAESVDTPGFQAVLDIGRNSDAVVKLTTPFALGLPRAEQQEDHAQVQWGQ